MSWNWQDSTCVEELNYNLDVFVQNTNNFIKVIHKRDSLIKVAYNQLKIAYM